MTAQRPMPTEAEISRALAAAIKQGLRVTRYKAGPDGVEVHCDAATDAIDLDLIDWKK